MLRTTAAVLALTCCCVVLAAPAAAADRDIETTSERSAVAVTPIGTDVPSLLRLPTPEAGRGPILPALYVSLAALQAFDGYATQTAIARGAREANPLMRWVAGNGVALWAVKGGVTFASIYVGERLWRRHRRGEAVAMMVISNGLMSVVAARNVSVLRAGR